MCVSVKVHVNSFVAQTLCKKQSCVSSKAVFLGKEDSRVRLIHSFCLNQRAKFNLTLTNIEM